MIQLYALAQDPTNMEGYQNRESDVIFGIVEFFSITF
jgi:hypothetical protein